MPTIQSGKTNELYIGVPHPGFTIIWLRWYDKWSDNNGEKPCETLDLLIGGAVNSLTEFSLLALPMT